MVIVLCRNDALSLNFLYVANVCVCVCALQLSGVESGEIFFYSYVFVKKKNVSPLVTRFLCSKAGTAGPENNMILEESSLGTPDSRTNSCLC